jgi:hypothetical protein
MYTRLNKTKDNKNKVISPVTQRNGNGDGHFVVNDYRSGKRQHLPQDFRGAIDQAQCRIYPTAQMKEDAHVNNHGFKTAVQFAKITFREKEYDTDSPDAIYALVEEMYDEESFNALLEAIKTVDEGLASELEDYWNSDNQDEEVDETGQGGDDGDYDDDDDDDYYYDDDEYEGYEKLVESGKKQERKDDKREVGEYKRSGSKSQRDKWYGGFANNPDAQEWWHRIGKKNAGGKDMLDAKTAKEQFEEYLKYTKKI